MHQSPGNRGDEGNEERALTMVPAGGLFPIRFRVFWGHRPRAHPAGLRHRQQRRQGALRGPRPGPAIPVRRPCRQSRWSPSWPADVGASRARCLNPTQTRAVHPSARTPKPEQRYPSLRISAMLLVFCGRNLSTEVGFLWAELVHRGIYIRRYPSLRISG